MKRFINIHITRPISPKIYFHEVSWLALIDFYFIANISEKTFAWVSSYQQSCKLAEHIIAGWETKNGKLLTRIFYSSILLSQNSVTTQYWLLLYILCDINWLKTLVDLTDSTYVESTPGQHISMLQHDCSYNIRFIFRNAKPCIFQIPKNHSISNTPLGCLNFSFSLKGLFSLNCLQERVGKSRGNSSIVD